MKVCVSCKTPLKGEELEAAAEVMALEIGGREMHGPACVDCLKGRSNAVGVV